MEYGLTAPVWTHGMCIVDAAMCANYATPATTCDPQLVSHPPTFLYVLSCCLQSAPTPLVVPYAERHLQQRVVSLRGQLQANLGRKPTLQELSAAGGLPVERVRQLLDMHAWQVSRWGEAEVCLQMGQWMILLTPGVAGLCVAC